MNKNIIANYISQIYVALIGIVILPLYIKYMGAEAYGLMSFFTMLQTIFMLLDLGLTPTIGRETARYHAKAISENDFSSLYRVLHILFIIVAVIGALALLGASSFFLNHWLKIESLNPREVLLSLQIMALCIALRWVTGLYRGIISGSELFVWLGGFNVIFATLRSIVVVVMMAFVGMTLIEFFVYQLILAIAELVILKFKVKKILNFAKYTKKLSIQPIKNILKFSLTIAFTSAVWVLLTQTDKFVLSGILSLEEYGYFNLAVLLASGIMMLSGPIHTTIMPRITHLYAENKEQEVVNIYSKFTQLITILVGSVTIVVVLMAKEILLVWTNNSVISENAYQILQLYALGNGILAWCAFPYFLQYAQGNLRYHLWANIVTVLVMVPVMIVVAKTYGAIGTGFAWMLLNAVTFLLWVPYLHKKFLPKLHLAWFFRDIVKILLPSCLVAFLIIALLPESTNRITNLMYVIFVGMVTLLSMICVSDYRKVLMKYARFKY